jgi:hypothetical protein
MASLADLKSNLESGQRITRSAWDCGIWVELFKPPAVKKPNINDPQNPIIQQPTPDQYYLRLNTSELEIDNPTVFVGLSRYYPDYLDVTANDWEVFNG